MLARPIQTAIAMSLICAVASSGVAFAQAIGGPDAVNELLSPANLKSHGIRLIWRQQLPGGSRGLAGVTPAAFASGRFITYLGFKQLAYYGSAGDVVVSHDFQQDLDQFQRKLGTPTGTPSLSCPMALTAFAGTTTTAPDLLTPSANVTATATPPIPAGRRGGAAADGPSNLPRNSAVLVGQPLPPRTSEIATAMRPAPGMGRVNTQPAAAKGVIAQNLYAIASDGTAYALNSQDGTDVWNPVRFLPRGAYASGAKLYENGRPGRGAVAVATIPDTLTGKLFATTTNGCNGTDNGLWKLDWSNGQISHWASGANIAGNIGPVFGSDGAGFAVYLATGTGTSNQNSVIAVDPSTLRVKARFTASAPFTSAPVTFIMNGTDVVAAANRDGKLYILDGAKLAGAPLAVSPAITRGQGDYVPGALGTWVDGSGVRWIAVPVAGPVTGMSGHNGPITHGALVAFKLVHNGSGFVLEPGWVSSDLTTPTAPTESTGSLFILSTGQATAGATVPARIAASKPGVLYALDSATGATVWNSGKTIAAPGSMSAPSISANTVLVSTIGGVVYAFGKSPIF